MKIRLCVLIIVVLTGYASASSGSREDPLPMGTTVDLGDGWQIAVMSIIPDATSVVHQENQFNNPPKAGNQFFIARIQAKYTGSSSATFGGSYRLRAVGPSSVGYSTFANSPGVIPDPLPDSEVFSGGIIEGNIGWEIKSSDAGSLVMYDNPISFGGNADRAYMALYGGPIGSSSLSSLTPKLARLSWHDTKFTSENKIQNNDIADATTKTVKYGDYYLSPSAGNWL